MQGLKIRKVKKTDLKALSKIYAKAFSNQKIKEVWSDKAAFRLLDYILNESDLCFLAEMDNQIIGGFFTVVKPWWNGNYLCNGELFIDPKHQREGAGKELMKFTLEQAVKKHKATHWLLETFRGDYQSKWYERLGMKEMKNLVPMTGDLKRVIKNLKR